MHGKFWVSIALFLSLGAACAQPVELAPGHPESYTVAAGDTLWDIAGRFLAQPWRWSEVWRSNPQIKDPNLIYPGDVLTLSNSAGQPLIQVSRGTEVRSREVKLSPAIRESRRVEAIPPIPLDAIRQFLSRPLVLTQEQVHQAGYVVGNEDNRLAVGPGARVYLKGLESAQGNAISLFRLGGQYRDPDSGEMLGLEALHVADAIVNTFGEPATATVGWASREIMKGDRVLPQENASDWNFVPKAPEKEVSGRIIAVVDGVTQVGLHNVVVLNRGAADGLAPGNVLAIYQSGSEEADPTGVEAAYVGRLVSARAAAEENPSAPGRLLDRTVNALRSTKLAVDRALGQPVGPTPKVRLPEVRAGELMVFRTAERVSFALVMSTQRALHVLDTVRNP